MGGYTRGCCFVVCFCVWQSWQVRSGECTGIRFRRVLFGTEGRLCRMKFCPMKGMKVDFHPFHRTKLLYFSGSCKVARLNPSEVYV